MQQRRSCAEPPVGLGLAADELVTGTLKLLIDVQFPSIQVDTVPRKAKDFAPAQAQDQDQDVSRIQHVVVAAGRFEEPGALPTLCVSRKQRL